MNEPLFSIIIPVYNCEKYIKETLDSIFEQDFNDYEVICIDDCSTDGSYDLLLAAQKKYENLKVIKNNVNMHQGAARNRGIEVSKGKYLWFVDSDDLLEKNALKNLSIYLSIYPDILFFHCSHFFDESMIYDNNHYNESINLPDWKCNQKINFKNELVKDSNFPGSPWWFVVKKSYLGNLRFREVSYREDTDFVPVLISQCTNAYMINYTAYRHRIRAGSDVHSSFNIEKLNCDLYAAESMYDFIAENKIPCNSFFYKKFYNFAVSTYYKRQQLDDEKKERITKIYKKIKTSRIKSFIKNMIPLGMYKLLKNN